MILFGEITESEEPSAEFSKLIANYSTNID